MSAPCACDGLDADRADDLRVVGGSVNPSDAPWGELRQCERCGAYFRYTKDHDNEIGYVEDPPTLDRLDPAGALRLAEGALTSARRLHGYFVKREGEYAARAAREYAEEIARLEAAIVELRGRSD